MNKKKLGIFLLISVISLNAQTFSEKQILDYTKINISGAGKVIYHTAAQPKIMIQGNSDVENIKVEVSNNTLNINLKSNKIKVIDVYGKLLESIAVNDAVNFITADTITATKFYINSSGASNIKANLKNAYTNLQISGAANIKLTGVSHKLITDISGAANINAFDLITDTCFVSNTGASNSKYFVNNYLSVLNSGIGNIKFKGSATVDKSGSGIGKILKIESNNESVEKDSSLTSLNFKKYKIEIYKKENNDSVTGKKRKTPYSLKHWQGLWMGFSGYTTPQQNFSMPNNSKYMELDYARSFSFQWNIIESKFNLYKKYISLSTGLGFHFNNLKFENKTTLKPDSSYTWGKIDSTNYYSYNKNRFKQIYAAVPLLLNINTSPYSKNNFHITFGVLGKYLLSARTKQNIEHNGDEFNKLRVNDYNLNPFQADAYASIGFRRINVFAQYALMPFFKQVKGPELNAFTIGIRLLSFN
ncbi:MAG: DUF2807 domain-containing protein [Bacteroidetes bacterium]|nr:DUF2807 domain-containing protein [Bacteroidota bacterium]